MQKRILIVDDEEDLREILRHNLTKNGYKVLEAEDGIQALQVLERKSVDLIILDIMMPEKDGYEVCREIQARKLDIPIIFLTAKDSEFDEVLGLELGADDYIKKPFSVKALISRIRTVLRRIDKPQINHNVVRYEGLVIDLDDYTIKVDDDEIFLPRKEFDLLAFLATHPGKVFSRNFLLNRVWGEGTYVIDRTVDVHIGRIRKKLGPYKKYLKTMVGVGYKFQSELTEPSVSDHKKSSLP